MGKWGAIALLLLLSAGCNPGADDDSPAEAVTDSIAEIDPAMLNGLPEGSTIEMLTQGRELYVVCSVCHGLDATGTQLGPSLRDTTWIHIPGDIGSIAGVIRGGVSSPTEFPVPMPVMGGGDFDETELRALATYVYALGRNPG